MGGEEDKKQTNPKQAKIKQRCLSVTLVIQLYSQTVQMWGEGGDLWDGPGGFLGRGRGHELSVWVCRVLAVLSLLGC